MTGAITRRSFAAGLAVSLASAMAGVSQGLADKSVLRIGVSTETLAGANLNDARAAYRIWGAEIARNLKLTHAEILPEVFFSSSQMLQMIRTAQIEAMAITALEYARAREMIDTSVAVIEDYMTAGIDYLLLVQSRSGYRKIEELKKTPIALLRHRDTALLRVWLSMELAGASQPEIEDFFSSVETREKVNEVILPLFFGKVQAVAISRRAFQVASEFNPQVGRQLRVLATSPKVVPAGFWFRKGCDADGRNAFMQAMTKFSAIPAGRQVLALYQSSGFVICPGTAMNGTMEVLHQFEKMKRKG